MSSRSIELFLSDIKESIDKIEEYVQKMSFNDFEKDSKTVDAVVRNIEIIGEAAKNIPSEIRLKHVEIPWKEIVGSRSKAIHEYFGIDLEILWKTVIEDIPRLKKQIKKIKSR